MQGTVNVVERCGARKCRVRNKCRRDVRNTSGAVFAIGVGERCGALKGRKAGTSDVGECLVRAVEK